MKNVYYDISLFRYDKESKTFFGNSWELWDMDNKYKYPFPTGKKQFYIKNPKTDGFRRFRFISEIEYVYEADRDILSIISSVPENVMIEDIKTLNEVLVFESEDGISCVICHKHLLKQ
jgi:hypothetical protein